MADLYNEAEFYGEEACIFYTPSGAPFHLIQYSQDNERPVWDDDIDVPGFEPGPSATPDLSRKKKKKKKSETDGHDAGVDVDDMDADNPGFNAEEAWDGTEEMRKRKVQEYMDDIYGMEFNDVVCLFHVATSFM